MLLALQLLIVTCVLALFTAASGPTKIYIDSVPEYDLLSSCAEHQVSLIVRSMLYGCGDGSETTSYACFCYQSSAYYSRMISTKVTSACSKTRGQENSALEVFSKYCQLADIEKITTTALEPTASTDSVQSTTVSPASKPTAPIASSTGAPTPQTTEPPKKKNTAAIAAGVTIPVVVIALGLVGLFIYFDRRKRTTPDELPAHAENQATEVPGAPVAYEKEFHIHKQEKDSHFLHELDANGVPGELAGSTSEQDRSRKIERLFADGDHS